jgi:soluble lytic murein transglycosylase
MLRAVVAALFLLPVLIIGANAQDIQTRANQIRAAMDGRDFERAEQLTRQLRQESPSAFTANNYDYLLARLAERRGASAEASSLYTGVLNRNSVLAQYALNRLAGLARASGDLALERQYLTRLTASYPSSPLVSQARERMIESLRDSQNFRAVIPLLRPIASVSGVRGRSAMARLGEAYARSGEANSARSVFNQLVSGSRDDYALAASEGLDELDRSSNTKPDEFEALRRARIYLFNRHWAEARTHLLDIINRFPASDNRAEALYQTGFTYYREEKLDEAIKWFERAHEEFPEKKDGEQGYYWVATALQRSKRYVDAAARYIDFISAYPQSDLIEGAYRNVVDSFRYADKTTEAIEWSRKIGQVFAGKPLSVVALFNEARVELVRGNYQQAENLLLRLQAQPAYPKLFGSPTRGEAAYLRIYAIEQAGRLGEAARLYLAIPEQRDNYFGYRATMRLRAIAKTKEGRTLIETLARGYIAQARVASSAGRFIEAKDAANQALRLTDDDKTKRELLEILRVSYGRLPGYSSIWRYQLIPAARNVIDENNPATNDMSARRLGAELIFLGLYDEGAPLLRLGGIAGSRASVEASAEDSSASNVSYAVSQPGGDMTYSLAVYSNRGDQSYHAIAFAEPLFKSIPQDYRLELMPRDLIEMLYPAPYRDSLNHYAQARGVDPRLILALARQESRFNPSVKSSAAARGLLQFISETSTKLASDEGIEGFELDDVYEPDVAIRLAARYVADLFKLFPNNEYAVTVSYNTGEINAERWIFRSQSNEVDKLVAEVAIPETKDYVGKVINNYRAYQALYTRDLKPNF